VLLQAGPAEPVEDEKYHRPCSRDRFRQPGRGPSGEQRRDDLIEAPGSIGRPDRIDPRAAGGLGHHPDPIPDRIADRITDRSVGRRVHHWKVLGRAEPAAVCDHGAVKVSTRGDYAARALLSLALHESDRPTSVKEIAERTNLPQPYLEQILLAVKGAGLVRSKRGVGGGYVLARPPAEITVAEILAAVDGPLTTLLGEHDHCEGHCILQEVWVGVSEEMGKILEGYTLAELVTRTRIGHPEVEPRAPDPERATRA
jgi:Rrf2 family iron-sulfur cluster assembly transcriptional regulator